jgi:hypothetical protein
MNGMNTTKNRAFDHVEYLTSLLPGIDPTIDLVYNHTNGAVIDLAEIFLLNFSGVSPYSANDLIKKWSTFHEDHENDPDLKILHFCHSQGAIHTRNALAFVRKEIANRVVVVAIAPAVVVPKETCYRSYNYACKTDIVRFGELFFKGFIDMNECAPSKGMLESLEHRQQLILLDGKGGTGHDFQNPVFAERIVFHIQDYLTKQGKYCE